MNMLPMFEWRRSFIGNGYASGKTGIVDRGFSKAQIQVNDLLTGINSANTESNSIGEWEVSGLDPTREYVVIAIDILDDGVEYNPIGYRFKPKYY